MVILPAYLAVAPRTRNDGPKILAFAISRFCQSARAYNFILSSLTTERSDGLPRILAGSASALWISRPAQASLALRPAGSLDRQKRPLSRGFGPSGCPSKPLVSYQINRQLSGRYPPPQVTRAFGAHRNEPNLLYRAASISIAPRLNHRRARSPKPGPLISRRPRSELISAVLRGPATNMVSRVWRWQEIGFVSLIRHLK